jgi:hypothetical protein
MTANSPSITAITRVPKGSVNWSASRAPGGRSRNVSKPPTAVSAPRRQTQPGQFVFQTRHGAYNTESRAAGHEGPCGWWDRPGDVGWRHLPATSRRCRRSSVLGVTIRGARSTFGRIRPSSPKQSSPQLPGLDAVVAAGHPVLCRWSRCGTAIVRAAASDLPGNVICYVVAPDLPTRDDLAQRHTGGSTTA